MTTDKRPQPVYSTATGSHRKADRAPSGLNSGGSAKGPLKMRLEKQGRGGKAVTVLFNLPFGETEAKALQRELQGVCGCGGTTKDGSIELQGDMRDRVEAHLVKKGLKVVRAGG